MPEPQDNPPSMPLSTPEPMLLEMPVTIRKRLIIKGRVQHIGYRALVRSYAETLGIKGFVRNLPDRSVEAVCEGEPDAVKQFLKSIDRHGDPQEVLDINVTSISEAPPPPEGELKEFIIDYGRELSPVERESLERDEIMILGAGTLNLKVDGVGKDVRNMHSDMNKRFDHMAQRYDLIATSLVKAIDRIDRGFERMDQNSKKTDKAIEQSRKEVAASNRELAGAVKFMIRKLSGRPATAHHGARKKRK